MKSFKKHVFSFCTDSYIFDQYTCALGKQCGSTVTNSKTLPHRYSRKNWYLAYLILDTNTVQVSATVRTVVKIIMNNIDKLY